jgi:WD40-like Beta Propeller Repeat
VTELEGEFRTHRWPQVLPGSRAILFTTHASPLSGFGEAGIAVLNLKEHRQKTLIRGGTYGRYVPSGHLLYVKGGALFAVPFDRDRLEVRGQPVRIFDGVAYSNANGSAQFDVASTGTVVYRAGGSERVRIEWLDASGATRPLLREAGEYLYPTLSPDGERVAFVMERGTNQEIWTYDWQRDIRSRLTQGQMFNTNPIWMPSGRYILYQGPVGMSWVAADGSGASGLLIKSDKVYKSTQRYLKF